MSRLSPQELLAQLSGISERDAAEMANLEATAPEEQSDDSRLEALLHRVNHLAESVENAGGARGKRGASPLAEHPPLTKPTEQRFVETSQYGEPEFLPLEPRSYLEAELADAEVEALILKALLNRGEASGHQLADQLKLPFAQVEPLLFTLKSDQLVAHKGAATMNDYVYVNTDIGRERARRYADHCTYYGAAPVSLRHYIQGVQRQSIEGQRPTGPRLKKCFEDLLISDRMFARLGPAINSGRGLFLFGAPGNGKTSIAERVTRAFGKYIWIPRAIGVDGEIIRLFDPSNHEEAPLPQSEGLLETVKVDKRWVRIVRPTIVVGGELTMDNLEVTLNTSTGISEAPVQLKSNCGTLVIDDFGRQKMSTDELLNRWIVPLEKRYDYLNLANGKKIQVPFDQLIIFSTNLEPRDLCDDAFLRRIPYKIEIVDPDEASFRRLFEIMAPKLGLKHNAAAVDYLINTHYKPVNRPFRCCQPRDLLMQVRNYCRYHEEPMELSPERLDFAVENYFAVM